MNTIFFTNADLFSIVHLPMQLVLPPKYKVLCRPLTRLKADLGYQLLESIQKIPNFKKLVTPQGLLLLG
jgi:hypothetical protein